MSPEEFVEKVVLSYEQGRGIFKKKENAEDLVPEAPNNKQKALWLLGSKARPRSKKEVLQHIA